MKLERLAVFVLTGLYGGMAFAATSGVAGGGALEWEAPLQTITNSFTGPVAFAASTIAVVVSLATLAFADNLSGAGRQLVYLVLIIAALIGVVNLLTTLFTAGAALTGSPSAVLWIAAVVALAASATVAHAEVRLVRAVKARFARSAFAG